MNYDPYVPIHKRATITLDGEWDVFVDVYDKETFDQIPVEETEAEDVRVKAVGKVAFGHTPRVERRGRPRKVESATVEELED